MKRIGLISDTHGYLDPRLVELLADVDEIWHAGDIGTLEVLRQLQSIKPVRAVWGNADGASIRHALNPAPRVVFDADESTPTTETPKTDPFDPWPNPFAEGAANEVSKSKGEALPPDMLRFTVEGMDVLMTHIGGYPNRYAAKVKKVMIANPPDIFVAGHSHILKVIFDPRYNALHLNPGACGHYGIHTVRSALFFSIDGGEVKDMQVVDLGTK